MLKRITTAITSSIFSYFLHIYAKTVPIFPQLHPTNDKIIFGLFFLQLTYYLIVKQ